jgi:Flp pilus assembly protein TadD
MLRAEAKTERMSPLRKAWLAPLALYALLAGGCSSIGTDIPELLTASAGPAETQAADSGEPPVAQDELQKATEYWRKEYLKKPSELEPALNYAKNLKAMGQKGAALQILQQASLMYGNDRKLASEYGRLALELDQVAVAGQLLAVADDPALPDWRVISARGTVLSKQGKYADAIPLYEKALKLSDGKPSVLNNLALAYAMNGEAGKAEELLRQAIDKGGDSAKTRQNLTLVLGLQGKYDEATRTAAADLPAGAAAANTAMVRNMVKLEPKAMPPNGVIAAPSTALASAIPSAGASAPGSWSTKVASAAPGQAKAQPAVATATPPATPAALPWSDVPVETGSAPAAPIAPGAPAFKGSAQ